MRVSVLPFAHLSPSSPLLGRSRRSPSLSTPLPPTNSAAFVTDTLGPLVGEPWFDAVVKFRYVAWGNAVNTSRVSRSMDHSFAF